MRSSGGFRGVVGRLGLPIIALGAADAGRGVGEKVIEDPGRGEADDTGRGVVGEGGRGVNGVLESSMFSSFVLASWSREAVAL